MESLLFNIDLIDLPLECGDDKVTRYADDTTRCSCTQDIFFVISELKRIAQKMFDWCKNNLMKVNPRKWHVLFSSNIQTEKIAVDNTSITPSLSDNFGLGTKI